MMSFIFVASLLIHQSTSTTQNEPHDMDDQHQECGGTHQSPIDIPLTTDNCTLLDPLLLSWTSETLHFGIRNNGYSLQAVPFGINYIDGSDLARFEVLHHANDTNIRLHNSFYHTYSSPVNEDYYFDSLYLHWDSEHTINDSHYPLEVHLVHFSSDYYTMSDALDAYTNNHLTQFDDQNVLAVIAVLFEIGESNPVLNTILNAVHYHDAASHDESVIEMFYTEFDPMDLLPQDKAFIGYEGSLTAPPCYETVRWHIMQDKMTVSEEQMKQLRFLWTPTNGRPTHDINNRTIYECNDDIESEIVPKESTHDGYTNTSQWTHLYPECGGMYQSPIDISIDPDMNQCEQLLKLNWSSETVHFGLRTNGYSLQAIPFKISHLGGMMTRLEVYDTNIRLQNAFFNTYRSLVNAEYCFDSFHIHWGMNGSEHSMNGGCYPLEVHLVHYSCDYDNLGDAVEAYAEDELTGLDDRHVLAVIAVLFEIGDANPTLDAILSGVKHCDSGNAIDNELRLFNVELNPIDLLPESDAFIGYKGSLTAPPCYETVRWHVMKEAMTVSEEQMRQFRALSESVHAGIRRPLQDVGNRTMYECVDEAVNVDKDVMMSTDSGDDDDKWTAPGGSERAQWLRKTWFTIYIIIAFIFGIVFVITCIGIVCSCCKGVRTKCIECCDKDRGYRKKRLYERTSTDPNDPEEREICARSHQDVQEITTVN
eukprot:828545_1